MTVEKMQKALDKNNIPAKVLHVEKIEHELYEVIYTFDLEYATRDYTATDTLVEPELDELVEDIKDAVFLIGKKYDLVEEMTEGNHD